MNATQEDKLEEMWRIKREIGSETRNWEEYAAGGAGVPARRDGRDKRDGRDGAA